MAERETGEGCLGPVSPCESPAHAASTAPSTVDADLMVTPTATESLSTKNLQQGSSCKRYRTQAHCSLWPLHHSPAWACALAALSNRFYQYHRMID